VRCLVIAIHDVAPSTAAEAGEWRELVADTVAGPASLLLVPRYRGRDSWRAGPARAWARERACGGDEIVLHGWSHTRADGRDGAELAGRRPAEVEALIRDGLAELLAAGLPPQGFIAPAYAHPPAAAEGCRRAGLGWWATRASLAWEGGRRRLPSLGLGASTPSRRALSPAAARAAAGALARAPAVRLDLHPADLRHPRLATAGRDLLERLLAQGRRPVTHAALGRAG
jgi:predicted deacetylase